MALASLVFELDRKAAEQLTDRLLELGALSVSAEDADAGTEAEQAVYDEPGEDMNWQRLKLRVLFAQDADPRMLMGRACARAGVAVPQDLQVEAVTERDWVRESQEQFDPIRISERLWVVPSWHRPPAPPAIAVLLDPGVAFGTGSHPTTRLCLQWLERQICGGERVLDYGCGSGILAIASMKLGALWAGGVDIDPASIRAARENAARNGVSCDFCDSAPPRAFQVDIVVANILANPLKLLAPLLAGHVHAGGRIALSGILQHQRRQVETCYAQWFEFEPPTSDEGWVCLSGRRKVSS
ncbi:MAG: ribosomal protein L11 methyltransferase [Betaproteobacteria bacterium RIFCSPLOWO2_02_FULL_63_19]|nr:MAG: ribosomal protein L11 methyltransferase [Betaproteobacteria bacterium RIFCSPLOWO2_02_FULL_63_19]